MLRGCFVTGTDTAVGKTCISAGLLHWFAQRGLQSAGFKPVAAGQVLIDGTWVNDDVQALRAAGSVKLSDGEVGPCQLREACAPNVAAALEGRTIDRGSLRKAALALSRRADVLVAEGVGGVDVPLGDDWGSVDMAADLALPVVLVVGLRLGCMNHALLSAARLRAGGLALMGWFGNGIDPDMPWRSDTTDSLLHELLRRHQAPCLGIVPWLGAEASRPSAVAAHFDDAALTSAFGPRLPRSQPLALQFHSHETAHDQHYRDLSSAPP